jgi:N-acetylglucosaminyldiphosphoundecaprenol N-acetyl-beta-D-mannosaminyltransferase
MTSPVRGTSLVCGHPPSAVDRTDILGVRVSAVNLDSAVDEIAIRIAEKSSRHYVCVTGVHGIIESQFDPKLRAIHNAADLVTPDGVPLVWLNWWYGKRFVSRVYGPDLMLAACRRGEPEGWRHFFYGTTEATLTKLIGNLRSGFPRLQVAGSFAPPFRELRTDETEEIVSMINDSAADVVWVGLSTPKQERWMSAMRGRLSAPVLIGVGAAFDFHAGSLKQAPHWIQRIGMEWCFRMWTEPRRLLRRYLRNNPMFMFLIALQLLGLRRPWKSVS